MICASIGRTRRKMVIAEHKHLAEKGAALVELRVDWLSRDAGPCILKVSLDGSERQTHFELGSLSIVAYAPR